MEVGSRLMLHPENETPLESQSDFLAAIKWVTDRINPMYAVRRDLEREMAARFPAPEMPAPRFRTDTQAKVARCPRCGGSLKEEEGGA